MTKEPTLQLNKQTGKYEGYLLVQVEPELFRRILLKTVEEDETLDLTDPSTWASAIERVGKSMYWLDRLHTVVTPVCGIPLTLPPSEPTVKLEKTVLPHASKSTYQELEAKLREKADKIPPYQWFDMLMTPLPQGLSSSSTEKQQAYYIRSDERKILKTLYAEWEDGQFPVNANALLKQTEHEEQEARKSTKKIEAIAGAVNGARLR